MSLSVNLGGTYEEATTGGVLRVACPEVAREFYV